MSKYINLSKYIYNKCVDFAETRIDMSADLYTYRGKTSREKMVEDIIVGTLGEYAVYNYLKSKNVLTSKPDLKIYEGKKKSFAADLVGPDYTIHVKSQSKDSAKKYGNSWLLQKTDRVIRCPEDNEYFAFVEVCPETRECEILGIVKCKDIVTKDLLEDCKVPWFNRTKRAIYFESVKNKLSKKRVFRL